MIFSVCLPIARSLVILFSVLLIIAVYGDTADVTLAVTLETVTAAATATGCTPACCDAVLTAAAVAAVAVATLVVVVVVLFIAVIGDTAVDDVGVCMKLDTLCESLCPFKTCTHT
jgi:hypothetical protein